MEWLPSHRFIEYHCAVIERLLNETGVFRSFFERFWTEGSLAHFLQQLFYCKDFCWKMTKNCLHEDEKSAPFLRQKPVKKCLFSSIWREKADRNKLSICYVIYRFSYNMTQQQFIIPNRPLDYYALTNFGINPTISRHGIAQARLALLIWLNEMVLFVICLSVFRLQWNPIAPSKRRDICSKTRVVIIITLMTDLG